MELLLLLFFVIVLLSYFYFIKFIFKKKLCYYVRKIRHGTSIRDWDNSQIYSLQLITQKYLTAESLDWVWPIRFKYSTESYNNKYYSSIEYRRVWNYSSLYKNSILDISTIQCNV